MKQKYLAVTFCLMVFTAGLVAAWSGGPPDGRTGAPGDSNCTVGCHSSFALNSGNGTLSISGPSTYEPNGTSIITIDLAQSGQSRWGFEATALDTNDLFVGFFMDDDPNRTQVSIGVTREYIKHTAFGTDAGTANTSPGWNIHWVAPSVSVGPVTIYVAGNAANNNAFNTGDYIYTTSFTINPASTSCCVQRGDVDGSGGANPIDIGDLIFLVAFMFQNGDVPPCMEHADVDGSGGANPIDIGDLIFLVAFMFQNGDAPAACP